MGDKVIYGLDPPVDYFDPSPNMDKRFQESLWYYVNADMVHYVTPSFWERVEVLRPTKEWLKWHEGNWNRYNPEIFLAHTYVGYNCKFVDKWDVPDDWLNWVRSEWVTFDEDKTHVMSRKIANKIMWYDNSFYHIEKDNLYKAEYAKMDWHKGTYDGTYYNNRDNRSVPLHPEILRGWEHVYICLEKIAMQKRREAEELARIATEKKKEQERIEYEKRPEVRQQRYEEAVKRKLAEEEEQKRRREIEKKDEAERERLRVIRVNSRYAALMSGDLKRQVDAGWLPGGV